MTIHFYKAKIRDSPSLEFFSADDSDLFKSSPRNVLLNKNAYLRNRDILSVKEITSEEYSKEILSKGAKSMERLK